MDNSALEECLGEVTDFENIVLPTCRGAEPLTVTGSSVLDKLGWARQLDILLKTLDPKDIPFQRRLLTAFIDNFQIRDETLKKHLVLFFDNGEPRETQINNINVVVQQRRELKRAVFRKNEIVRKDLLFRAFVTSPYECSCVGPDRSHSGQSPAQLMTCVLIAALKNCPDQAEKVKMVQHVLKSDLLENPDDQQKLLEKVNSDLVDGTELLKAIAKA